MTPPISAVSPPPTATQEIIADRQVFKLDGIIYCLEILRGPGAAPARQPDGRAERGGGGATEDAFTSPMTSRGINAAIMAGMLRRITSPASTANPNAHRM
jgi:hypothetical protein